MKIRLFNQETIEACLDMRRTIELMEEAFVALSAGKVDSPLRTGLTNENGTILYKPAYSSDAGIFCAKIVSVFAGNAQRNLPVTPGIIVVNSGETGLPVAILDAGYLTSLRTGAATGLATRLLAPPDAKTAALFGSGGQAQHQLEAMLSVRDLETIFVFSRTSESAIKFCKNNSSLAGTCEFIPNPDRSVLKSCEVITTATTSSIPVFADGEIADTVHINGIGSLGKTRTEIPAETLLKGRIFVDQREACLAEAGEICQLRDKGLLPTNFHPVEIGELVAGTETLSERDKNSITIFLSVGNAAQDLVCSAEVLNIANERKLGSEVSL